MFDARRASVVERLRRRRRSSRERRGTADVQVDVGGTAVGTAGGRLQGWWNATPASGSAAGLLQETVAINTRTNMVVDAFSRRINDAGRPTNVTDVPYTVDPDPSWPADSVIIIDTATNRVIENFRVDLNGYPLR